MTKIMWQHSSISKANRIQAFSIYGCGTPVIFNRDFCISQFDCWKAKTSHVMETFLLTNSLPSILVHLGTHLSNACIRRQELFVRLNLWVVFITHMLMYTFTHAELEITHVNAHIFTHLKVGNCDFKSRVMISIIILSV